MGFDKFIVTGLPRSRTGWLANLLTYGSSFCLHDGLQHGPDVNTTLNVIRDALDEGIKHLGNSDSGIPLICEPADFKDYKVVVVRRDKFEAEQSFVKFFEANPYPHLHHMTRQGVEWTFECANRGLLKLIHETPQERLHLVDFNDLDDSRKVEKLWDFIVPDQEFCKARFATLKNLRINAATEKVSIAWA